MYDGNTFNWNISNKTNIQNNVLIMLLSVNIFVLPTESYTFKNLEMARNAQFSVPCCISILKRYLSGWKVLFFN